MTPGTEIPTQKPGYRFPAGRKYLVVISEELIASIMNDTVPFMSACSISKPYPVFFLMEKNFLGYRIRCPQEKTKSLK